ncbi:copper type II ascorbate-dependent monooxygenase domain protein [Ancylostoma caninum]|uniref:Copper type II ascorbate-dependent monooxygenase domain protein n=1 Tax=Ancylostoma caninum TaxID=29170 RepID=A0A368G5H0_ANCCA|nr:copper type II ascorbate-dependent monooxygenase domain protein [Ancylostoma caninum]
MVVTDLILSIYSQVPNVVTTYWCVIKRIPSVISSQKHHIIQINPIIRKGNENLVHHMEQCAFLLYREFDAGIMEIGLIYSDANSIPPGQTAFPLTGHCVADCTSKLPSGGIRVFGSQLHAHLSGRKIFTSHYRHGVKIAEINRDNHYSPHWQHIVFIRPYIHVMPGDVLSTTCVYETLNKDVMTLVRIS